jgi:hypothetical protein
MGKRVRSFQTGHLSEVTRLDELISFETVWGGSTLTVILSGGRSGIPRRVFDSPITPIENLFLVFLNITGFLDTVRVRIWILEGRT